MVEKNKKMIKCFKKLKPGDIIWAKRYRTKEEKENFKEGHRAGPYLIIKVENNKLYCLYGTSKKPSNQRMRSFYKCKFDENDTELESYFDINLLEEIDINRYLGKRNSIKQEDLNKIYSLLKRRVRLSTVDCNVISLLPSIEVGDIIKKDYYYLVINKRYSILRCLKLNNKGTNLNNGINYNLFANLESDGIVEIVENNFIEYICHIDDVMFEHILNQRSKYLENIKTAKRGSILIKDNKMYYVYNREGEQLYSYEIFDNMKDSSIKVLINGLTYYIDFNNVNVINYYDDYKIKFLTNEYDMDKIKKIREKYLRKQKNKNTTSCETNKPKTKYNNLKEGNIVKLKNNEKCNYVVIKCYNDLLVCISELDLLNKHKNILIININNIKYVCKEITEKRIENNKLMLKNLYDEKELNKIIVENIRRNEFNNVKVFDIIDAKNIFENDKKIELELLDEESYLVIGRDEKRLYCLRGSREIKEYSNFYIVFSCLIKDKDNEEKRVYYTNKDIKIINYDNFININKTLNDEEKIDLIRILKKQTMLKNKKIYYDIDLSFNIGDIIKKERLYLIINKIDSDLYCVPFDKNINLEKIDYNDIILINENDNIEFVNKIISNLLNRINLNELNYIKFEKHKIKKLTK